MTFGSNVFGSAMGGAAWMTNKHRNCRCPACSTDIPDPDNSDGHQRYQKEDAEKPFQKVRKWYSEDSSPLSKKPRRESINHN